MMFATIIDQLMRSAGSPIMWLILGFQVWMLIDALRRQEWIWAAFMFFFPFGLNAILYYFLVYRANRPAEAPTFEIPGAASRARIKELQAQIHHLDKAHHHAELANIYFKQGKLKEAEAEYLAALEREPSDLDTRAHYGELLLRAKRTEEARAVLEQVCAAEPHHDYGQTMMHYAQALAALGQTDAAITAYEKTLERNTYGQARVEMAELLIKRGDKERARRELQEVIADAGHVPAFQRKREKEWVKRAEALKKSAQ